MTWAWGFSQMILMYSKVWKLLFEASINPRAITEKKFVYINVIPLEFTGSFSKYLYKTLGDRTLLKCIVFSSTNLFVFSFIIRTSASTQDEAWNLLVKWIFFSVKGKPHKLYDRIACITFSFILFFSLRTLCFQPHTKASQVEGCVCACVCMLVSSHVYVCTYFCRGRARLTYGLWKSHDTILSPHILHPFLRSPHLLLIPIPFYPPFLSSSSLLFVEIADTHHSGGYGMGAHIFQTYLFAEVWLHLIWALQPKITC